MIYGSVCSGIEAATVAWKPLGWKAAFYSEIEPFPRALLSHHYPDTPLHGDFTTIKENEYGSIELLAGGTPCQDFSLAGLRKGITGERGNLTLEFVLLAKKLIPRWLVWENVPGVLSITGGRAFGAFLSGLGQCGYGFAYRVLDAQHFGVPQRRKRVVLVGYLGDWRPAAAVLFERESLLRDLTPSREASKDIAPTIRAGASNGGAGHGARSGDSKDELIVPVSPTLDGRSGRSGANSFATSGGLIPSVAGTQSARTGLSRGAQDAMGAHMVAHSLRGEGFDASEDGTGRGTPLVVGALTAKGPEGFGSPNVDADHYIPSGIAVRRITPLECERLQGFTDNYTLIPVRGKPAADGPRYKAIGNSWAVPKFVWVGQRIQLVDNLIKGIV